MAVTAGGKLEILVCPRRVALVAGDGGMLAKQLVARLAVVKVCLFDRLPAGRRVARVTVRPKA